MTQKDRDNYFATMVLWNMFEDWRHDDKSEINEKDRHKISTIQKMIIELLVQYGKREGKLNLQNLTDESLHYHFAVIKNDNVLDLNNTFDIDLAKGAIKKVVEKNSFNCFICDRTDFKNCEWFSLRNILNSNQCENKNCPYRGQIM